MNSKVSFGSAAVAALPGMPLLRTRPAPVWTRAGATDGTVGGDELSFTQLRSPVIIFCGDLGLFLSPVVHLFFLGAAGVFGGRGTVQAEVQLRF
jgi:hypothetical protein